MAARIRYNSTATTPWGQQVAILASQVIRTQQLATRIIDAFNSMSAGGAGPWTQLETELNLVPGQGTLLYTILNDTRATLNSVANMNEIDQGGGI